MAPSTPSRGSSQTTKADPECRLRCWFSLRPTPRAGSVTQRPGFCHDPIQIRASTSNQSCPSHNIAYRVQPVSLCTIDTCAKRNITKYPLLDLATLDSLYISIIPYQDKINPHILIVMCHALSIHHVCTRSRESRVFAELSIQDCMYKKTFHLHVVGRMNLIVNPSSKPGIPST